MIAEAPSRGLESKLFVFDVIVKDEGDLVGKAIHFRAIVVVEKFEGKAGKRVAGSTGAP